MKPDSRALELHRACVPVDLHADTPVLLRFGYDIGSRHEPPLPRGALGMNLDLPRMREGGLAAQFFGLVSLPRALPFGWGGPKRTVDALLDALETAAANYPNQFVLARTVDEIQCARNSGKIAGLCGIEGAHALEGNLDNLVHFANRGVCYLGLVHFSRNQAAAPAYGKGTDPDFGLTKFGHELLDELHRLKIIVDLAHLNRKGFLETAIRSRQPVIVSHTGVSGIHPHWRNIDDEQIRAVAKTGGCVGVIFSRRFLGRANLRGVCTHLSHLIKVGGEDLPALGSDFDGLATPPRGLEDISRLPNLTATMLQEGLSSSQVAKILGENVLRVLEKVRGGI
ncbi:MAG: dipeptidase [Pseudomonadota bacterium]